MKYIEGVVTAIRSGGQSESGYVEVQIEGPFQVPKWLPVGVCFQGTPLIEVGMKVCCMLDDFGSGVCFAKLLETLIDGSGAGAGIARIGDNIQVTVSGPGTYIGQIIDGSDNMKLT